MSDKGEQEPKPQDGAQEEAPAQEEVKAPAEEAAAAQEEAPAAEAQEPAKAEDAAAEAEPAKADSGDDAPKEEAAEEKKAEEPVEAPKAKAEEKKPEAEAVDSPRKKTYDEEEAARRANAKGVDEFYNDGYKAKELPDTKISRRNFAFHTVMGMPSMKRYNLHFLNPNEIIYVTGNKYQTYNMLT